MKAIELRGEIGHQHRLRAQVPEGFPSGSVGVAVLMPEKVGTGLAWAGGFSAGWSVELSDPKQDVHPLHHGQPVSASR
jgi:hypothetical protein